MPLCPGDNMGQRAWLGSILIRVSPVADAFHCEDASNSGVPSSLPLEILLTQNTKNHCPNMAVVRYFILRHWRLSSRMVIVNNHKIYRRSPGLFMADSRPLDGRRNPNVKTPILKNLWPGKPVVSEEIRVAEFKALCCVSSCWFHLPALIDLQVKCYSFSGFVLQPGLSKGKLTPRTLFIEVLFDILTHFFRVPCPQTTESSDTTRQSRSRVIMRCLCFWVIFANGGISVLSTYSPPDFKNLFLACSFAPLSYIQNLCLP